VTQSLANTFAYVSPVIAVILGALLLREPVTIITIVAMCVILTGVALMVTTTGKDKKEKKEKNLKKQIQNKTQFNSIHSSHLALKYLCNQIESIISRVYYLPISDGFFPCFLILFFPSISAIAILTADIPVLNGYAPFPWSLSGFIHS
jgi:glucose uptake protein GlcU